MIKILKFLKIINIKIILLINKLERKTIYKKEQQKLKKWSTYYNWKEIEKRIVNLENTKNK